MDEKKKFVLITGASSGIGKKIAVGLSTIYNLILSGRNYENLIATQKKCSTQNEQLIYITDLSSLTEVEDNLTSFIKENNIEIIKYVHSAGCMKMLPIKMLTLDNINSIFSTNLISVALIMKVLINKKFNNASLDSVVFISSNISNFGAKAFSIYGSSKAGLDGLMRNLAVELAPKVRVNSVLPGSVKTEMTAHIYEDIETINRMEASYPLGLGNVDDIFEVVNFLLSDKARWITGQQFTIDGGRTINITG